MGATAVQPELLPPSPPHEIAKPVPKWKTLPWHLIALGMLTIFAGFIRFAWIDRPSLWNDEGHTFRRLTGNFQDLLDVLQVSGFSPLHYLLYWKIGDALGGAHKLTPFWMRLVPSLAGTLMVPAIYFLARQLCSKRTSLLVAAYAACSAYLMVYAHDAKMYMHFWLCCTLNVGCLLWWFRTNLRVAWLGWIAAGVAMGGLQAVGLLLLAIQPLMFLVQPVIHWKKAILFLIGAIVIAAGPVGYYLSFDRWDDQMVETNWESASGLTWIPQVIGGRDGDDLLRFGVSAWLYSWEWPRERYDPEVPASGNGYKGTGDAFRSMLQGSDINPKVYAGLATAVFLTLFIAAAGLLPWPAKWRGASPSDPPTAPWSLSTFYLVVWLLVPAYAFYCVSMPGFDKPADWLTALGEPFQNRWAMFLLAVACISALCMIWRYIPMGLAALLGLITASIVIAAFYKGIFQVIEPKGSYNAGRRIYPILTSLLFNPKFLVPAMIITASLSWYYCAPTLALRTGRLFQFAILLFATYVLLEGTVYAIELIQKNLDTGTVWMPRYMAFAWPAFAIALCALIMRLPTRPVRYLAIALLLGVNLAQAWGRMFAGSEPPIDHIMRDLWAAESSNDTIRTYVQQGGTSAHPAGGSIGNNPGRYYLSINRGAAWHPLRYLDTEIGTVLTVRNQSAPYAVAADLRRNPDVSKVIIWERLPEKPQDTSADPHLALLGPQWHRQSDEFFPVRFHWNWSELYTARRKVYVRKP